jgi:hypothetical protein
MATFAKIDAGQPVRNGAVTCQPLPGGEVPAYHGHEQDINDPSGLAQMARVNAAYKAGATTGWERPGSDLT